MALYSKTGALSIKPSQLRAGIVVRQNFNKIAACYCHGIRSVLAHPHPMSIPPGYDRDGVTFCGYGHRSRRQAQHLPKLDACISLAANKNGIDASARGVRLRFEPSRRVSRQADACFLLKLRGGKTHSIAEMRRILLARA